MVMDSHKVGKLDNISAKYYLKDNYVGMVLFGPSISKGGVFTKYEIRVKYYDTTNHDNVYVVPKIIPQNENLDHYDFNSIEFLNKHNYEFQARANANFSSVGGGIVSGEWSDVSVIRTEIESPFDDDINKISDILKIMDKIKNNTPPSPIITNPWKSADMLVSKKVDSITDLIASYDSNGMIELSFTTPHWTHDDYLKLQNYIVEYRPSGGEWDSTKFFTIKYDRDPKRTKERYSWQPLFLIQKKQYEFRVRTRVGTYHEYNATYSDWSNVSPVTPTPFVNQITDLKVIINSDGKPEFTMIMPEFGGMSKSTVIHDFIINYKIRGEMWDVKMAYTQDTNYNWPAGQVLRYLWNGSKLENGNTYNVRVMAHVLDKNNIGKYSEWSNIDSVSIPANAISTVTDLKAKYVESKNNVQLKWTQPDYPKITGNSYSPGIVAYILEAREHEKDWDNPITLELNANNAYHLLTIPHPIYNWDLPTGKKYDIRLKTLAPGKDNKIATSDWSNVPSVTVPPAKQSAFISFDNTPPFSKGDHIRIGTSLEIFTPHLPQIRIQGANTTKWKDMERLHDQKKMFIYSYTVQEGNGTAVIEIRIPTASSFVDVPICDDTGTFQVTPPVNYVDAINDLKISYIKSKNVIYLEYSRPKFRTSYSSVLSEYTIIAQEHSKNNWDYKKGVIGRLLNEKNVSYGWPADTFEKDKLYDFKIQTCISNTSVDENIPDLLSEWSNISSVNIPADVVPTPPTPPPTKNPTCKYCESVKVLCVSEQTMSNFRNGKPAPTQILNNFTVFACESCGKTTFIDLSKLENS